jgi:hypothetical protein
VNTLERYEQFHGRPPKNVSGVDFHVPKRLVLIGQAIAIEYKCDKLNGGGDGKQAVYRHEFETPSVVCMDETGRKQLYVIGPQIVVDERGIRK